MRRFALLFVLVACGDNASPCAYTEANDLGNAEAAEPTQLAIGDGFTSVCGAIDPGHPGPTGLDVDAFRITAPGGDLLFEVAGGAGSELFTTLTVRLFDTAALPTLLAESKLDPTLVDHGAFLADVPPGDYDVVVSATAPGTLSGPVDYRVQVSAHPIARCPAMTSPPDHEEVAGADNGVLAMDYMQDPWFAPTAAANDAPEATGISITAGEAYRLTGQSTASPGADDDAFLDRDTYELTTGAYTNELTLRLDWTGQADLDYHVFDADRMMLVASSMLTPTAGPELQTFAVAPKTRYLLWIGQFAEATTPGADVSYDAAICGTHFFDGVP